MLLHVRSTVLVKGVVLAVTAVEQGLESQNDVGVHGADPVTPEKEDVQGRPDLAAILRGQILLHMLPCRGGGVWAWRMAQTFFTSMRNVMANGLLVSSSSLLPSSSASGCRIGARKINSESMEEYTGSSSPKAGLSTSGGG